MTPTRIIGPALFISGVLEVDVTAVAALSVRAVFGFDNKNPETANTSSEIWQEAVFGALAVNRKRVDLLSGPLSL